MVLKDLDNIPTAPDWLIAEMKHLKQMNKKLALLKIEVV